MDNSLKNKKIILGITGSIAAYKTPSLVRELVKQGAHVNVVMTDAARRFVTPIALTNVSKNPVVTEMFDESTQNGGAWHIQLAHWADAMMIVPCSATTMGKIASGICDNSLVTVAVALPRHIPLLISPAMDFTMYMHPSTRRNERILADYGAIIIPPEEGELASGLVGPGRMPEIAVIIDELKLALESSERAKKGHSAGDKPSVKSNHSHSEISGVESDRLTAEIALAELKNSVETAGKLRGKTVMITAGPTIEKIDDVRFISNHSSGKTGYAIASAFAKAGAKTILISGPTSLPRPEVSEFVSVSSAEEMFEAARKYFPASDIGVFSAAVADFTPKTPFAGKIKKENTGSDFAVELVPTKDILAECGKIKRDDQIIIGFALESENETENARKKLESKNCDAVVVNSALKPRSGFSGDDNTITIIKRDGSLTEYPPMSKLLCADRIIKEASALIK